MSNYSVNKIFEDSAVNASLDMMYHLINEAGPVPDINAVFALTGKAAVHVQELTTGAVDNIIFITNDADVYAFVQDGLAKQLTNKGVIRFKERTIFYMPGFALEIWYEVGIIGIIEAQGVYVQETDKINPILL